MLEWAIRIIEAGIVGELKMADEDGGGGEKMKEMT